MRKVIEYTLISLDGVFADEAIVALFEYRDDAYMRDGLGQLLACDAMLMGRTTYESFSRLSPGRDHPWADRLNAMPKYVFSSKLEAATWNNSTILRGGVCAEVRRLKEQSGGNLLIYGHGLLAETLLKHQLTDAIDVSVHPLLLGRGKLLFRAEQSATLRLIAAKTFARGIVKLTYEPDYASDRIG